MGRVSLSFFIVELTKGEVVRRWKMKQMVVYSVIFLVFFFNHWHVKRCVMPICESATYKKNQQKNTMAPMHWRVLIYTFQYWCVFSWLYIFFFLTLPHCVKWTLLKFSVSIWDPTRSVNSSEVLHELSSALCFPENVRALAFQKIFPLWCHKGQRQHPQPGVCSSLQIRFSLFLCLSNYFSTWLKSSIFLNYYS